MLTGEAAQKTTAGLDCEVGGGRRGSGWENSGHFVDAWLDTLLTGDPDDHPKPGPHLVLLAAQCGANHCRRSEFKAQNSRF